MPRRAVTAQFQVSGSASKFMSTFVLLHESVSVSPYWVDGTLTDTMSNTQVRLTEHVLMLIRLYHPHLEQLLFKGPEFKVGLRELEFTPSFTVEEMTVNPWKPGIMDFDDFMVIDSGAQQPLRHPQSLWSWSRMARS